MTSFKGQASWAKMMSSEGQIAALVYNLTKKVNKAEENSYKHWIRSNEGMY